MVQWVCKIFADTITKFPLTTWYGSIIRSRFKSNVPELPKFISCIKLPRYNYRVANLNKCNLPHSPLTSNSEPLYFSWIQYSYNQPICFLQLNIKSFLDFFKIQNLQKDGSLSPWRDWQSHYTLNLKLKTICEISHESRFLHILKTYNHWFRTLRTTV